MSYAASISNCVQLQDPAFSGSARGCWHIIPPKVPDAAWVRFLPSVLLMLDSAVHNAHHSAAKFPVACSQTVPEPRGSTAEDNVNVSKLVGKASVECPHQLTRVPPPRVAPARMLRQVLSLFMAPAPSYIVLMACPSCSPPGLKASHTEPATE